MTLDVNTYLIDLPHSVRGLTTPNDDGSFSIFINARLNYEQQLQAYQHEMRHIQNDDFSKENVQEIEAVAHEIIKENAKRVDFTSQIERLKRRQRKIQKQLHEYRIYRNVPNLDMTY